MVLNYLITLFTTCFYFLIILFGLLVLIKIYLVLTLRTCTCKSNLDGKTVVITGGNTGIGFETAKILAERGARVVIASRNVSKSQAAVQAIIAATGNKKVECKSLDLSKFSSIKRFADDFNENYDRLDILINNAGFSTFEQVKTEDGIEKVMQVNHVGHVYLTNLLLNKIVSSRPSRIIFVASGAHMWHWFDPNDMVGNKPVNVWTRYSNTKLCNVLSAKALAKRVPKGVTVNSLHPGVAKTEIYEVVPGPLKAVSHFLLGTFCKTPEQCAQTSVHAASSPDLAEVSGQYFYDCEISKPINWSVNDEFAERVWDKTIALIEDRTRQLDANALIQ
ncbi:retinol dehydrogenase 11-like [Ostrinia nubilalis]|uniref:retinol dehydrogenase 11-like n=1 Tax=Ostrinia nubilalis TaxID=29057 RepID=UPI0030824069